MEKIEKFQVILSCIIITLGILVSSIIFSSKIPKNDSITVTGSASKIVKSDSAKLSFSIMAKMPTQKASYNLIKTQTPIVTKFLLDKGVDKKDIEIKPLSGYYDYKRSSNGYVTNEIDSYNASENIIVTSNDVEKIKEISVEIQNLVDKGISLETYPPEYFYSDLASIKIDLLKEATLDAKQRAVSMLGAASSRVGKVKSMRMGVFQITPKDSTSVSDMGMNDTTTIDKKVTAVANVVFKIK